MIRDYSVYKLSNREKLILYVAGYICIFCVVYLFYHSIILAGISGVLVWFTKPYAEKILADRRMDLLNLQFKDLLYSLSASVAAGRQMDEAIVEAEEALSLMYSENDLIMTELKHMRINIVENKESDKVLLQDFATRSHNEDIICFTQVYVTCRNMGGDLQKIIGHTTSIIVDKLNIQKEIKVMTNQKKSEGRVISSMPIIMLLAMNLFSYSYIEPLYETLMGRMVMTAALSAIIFGIYLMEKISDIKV